MRKKILLSIILLLNYYGFSQVNFEKGYFITNSDEKIDCLIKNRDWKNNPIDFEYKLSDNDKFISTNIKLVKEFGI